MWWYVPILCRVCSYASAIPTALIFIELIEDNMYTLDFLTADFLRLVLKPVFVPCKTISCTLLWSLCLIGNIPTITGTSMTMSRNAHMDHDFGLSNMISIRRVSMTVSVAEFIQQVWWWIFLNQSSRCSTKWSVLDAYYSTNSWSSFLILYGLFVYDDVVKLNSAMCNSWIHFRSCSLKSCLLESLVFMTFYIPVWPFPSWLDES